MTERTSQRVFAGVFLAPAFFLFTGFVALPGARALLYSLQKWDGLGRAEWIGLENFARLFQQGDLFLKALGHNLFIMGAAGSSVIGLALLFAALLHRRIRGAQLFRVAFFFPNVIAAVAVALLWVLLYSTTHFGIVNAFLAQVQSGCHALGWTWPNWRLPVPFLDSRFLIYSVVPMIIWEVTGFYMVLFLAAMEGIPESYYEAAKLDGATGFQQFRHITLPLIREVLTVGLVFLMISKLKFFDAIWVMENQTPTRDSHVLATLLYQKVFTEYNVGYGSAVAVCLFVLVFLGTLVSLRLSRAERIEY